MSSNVFNHPFLNGLLGSAKMSALFEANADIDRMLEFQSALAKAQGELGIIPEDAALKIQEVLEGFSPDIKQLNATTAIDGVVVPGLISQIRAAVGEPENQYVHIGVTSQDVIDTSLIMRLMDGLEILADDLGQVVKSISGLSDRFGDNQITARTRMQNAMSTNVDHYCRNWRAPLEKQISFMPGLAQEVCQLQLGGAIGDGAAFGDAHAKLSQRVAQLLGLNLPAQCWHTDRSALTNLANWLSQTSGALGKIGQDIVLMNLNEIGDIKLSATGTSSVMPDKANPVSAEILVTLARFNATQISAMHHALVHENHRSGSAWTLEWMILPQMMMATSASFKNAIKLLGNVETFGAS